MTKFLLGLFFIFASVAAQAESCDAIIRDRSGYELERYSATSYSRDAACSEAMYQCNRSLSDARSNGRYYDANCEVAPIFYPNPNPYPNPYPSQHICQTDLVDQYGRIVRSFSGYGRTDYEACNESERFCKEELYRGNGYGMRCVTRDGRNPNPGPIPPRNRTESCSAVRLDPAGMFIQSYYGTASGPYNTDVKGEACRQALWSCQRDLKGRQTCNIQG